MCVHHFLGSNIEMSRGSSYFVDLLMLGFTPKHHARKIEGWAKLIAPKIDFYFSRARISFLARANFLRQPQVTFKTFVFDRFSIMFLICSKKALVKMGLAPPSFTCRHFLVGTNYEWVLEMFPADGQFRTLKIFSVIETHYTLGKAIVLRIEKLR